MIAIQLNTHFHSTFCSGESFPQLGSGATSSGSWEGASSLGNSGLLGAEGSAADQKQHLPSQHSPRSNSSWLQCWGCCHSSRRPVPPPPSRSARSARQWRGTRIRASSAGASAGSSRFPGHEELFIKLFTIPPPCSVADGFLPLPAALERGWSPGSLGSAGSPLTISLQYCVSSLPSVSV